jgi:G:T/U-mismatch repair DNA glycosylase
MSAGIFKSPDNRYWRELYKAVLAEFGKSELLERIAEAEKAVVLRARELFQAAGDNGEETEALDDVMYALHALRSRVEVPLPAR